MNSSIYLHSIPWIDFDLPSRWLEGMKNNLKIGDETHGAKNNRYVTNYKQSWNKILYT